MINLKDVNKFNTRDVTNKLKSDYATSLKDEQFKKLVNRLKINEDIGMKYTSKLEHTVGDLNNCDKCKNLLECKNSVNGCVYYPKLNDDKLEFNYIACKYKNEQIKKNKQNKSIIYDLPLDLKNAKMSEIDINDKKRIEVIKILKQYHKNYNKEKNNKGLFLHGTFGCGKSYLIAALLNELSKNNVRVVMMYYPEMLTRLKGTFDKSNDNYYDTLLNEIKTSDILLIDDIGAETVTSWSRDEILGTILQYRMDNHLSTFITSNLNIEELEIHLSQSKNGVDKVKARRIIERIKQLTIDMELISVNRRQ